MAGLDDKYARDIHKELDHYAGILPCEHDFQLGDYGIMRGKKFEVMGNITQDFGIKVESKNTAASASFEYQSEKGVTFKHDGNATALAGNLKAGATIEFNRKNSFLVKAEEMSSKAINNYKEVGDKLENLYKKRGNDWKLRYHVVSGTLSAKYALVLGSSSGKGAVTLHAKFPIKSIVDIDLKDLSLSWDRSVSWHILDNEGDGCVPFIKLSKVNDPLLAKPSFEPVR